MAYWFHDFSVISNSLSGTGVVAAVEDEVKTKRLIIGSVSAASRVWVIPARTLGMTSLGFLLNDRFEAT